MIKNHISIRCRLFFGQLIRTCLEVYKIDNMQLITRGCGIHSDKARTKFFLEMLLQNVCITLGQASIMRRNPSGTLD